MQSRLYSPLFQKGQRCVIVCEGFYEWQTTANVKKASDRDVYYIFMPQSKIREVWKSNKLNLLKMAGLFDVWENENGETVYSYTIITFESNSTLSWLHHRSPAVLNTDQEVAVSIQYV